jgi:hypothetical protein
MKTRNSETEGGHLSLKKAQETMAKQKEDSEKALESARKDWEKKRKKSPWE